MAGRGTTSPRSAGEWCVRTIVALAAAALGYIAVIHAFAYTIRGTAIARAHALAPGDGRITGLLSEQMSGPNASSAERSRSEQVARQALRQDATAVSAVATLGINAQLQNDTARARNIFSYADKLSRRDLRTRLWAIEDAVARGDIQNALQQYDIALRTSRLASDLLFPVLAGAVADPAISSALISRLRMRPAWSGPFIVYLADNATDTTAAASLFEGIAKVGIVPPDVPRSVLIRRLTEQGKYDAAWNVYAAATSGVDRRQSRDPDFTSNLVQPSVFDWVPIENDGVTATIQHDEKGGDFYFAIPATMSGPVLRQMQLLPPGEYILEGRSTGVTQPVDSRPYWVLSCGNSTEVGRVPIGVDNQAGGRFSGHLHVPKNCPIQYLTFFARSSLQNEDVTGQINHVLLRAGAP